MHRHGFEKRSAKFVPTCDLSQAQAFGFIELREAKQRLGVGFRRLALAPKRDEQLSERLLKERGSFVAWP